MVRTLIARLRVPIAAALLLSAVLSLTAAGRAITSYVQVRSGSHRLVLPTKSFGLPSWNEALELGNQPTSLDRGVAVLFVYNAECSVCAHNMENWLQFIATVRQRHPATVLLAAGIESDSAQEAYWSHLADSVMQFVPIKNTDALIRLVGTPFVPLTVLMFNGRMVEAHIGLLGEERRARLGSRINQLETQ